MKKITAEKIQKKNILLDFLKFLCAILIVGAHCSPLFSNNVIDTYYCQWFFRFCVPLFLISSGFYFQKMDNKKRLKYTIRILIIYIISTIIYLPTMLKYNPSPEKLREFLIFGYIHLWYLSALFGSLLISIILEKIYPFAKHKIIYIITITILLIIGVLFDEYHKLFNSETLSQISLFLEKHGSSRNFLFMALPLITIGRLIFINREKIFNVKCYIYIILTIVFAILSFVELTIFTKLGIESISNDLTAFNYIPAIFLFILTFYWHPRIPNSISTYFRKGADIIYIVHILFTNILTQITDFRFGLRFLFVIIFSCLIAFMYVYIKYIIKLIFKLEKEIKETNK